jgi:acetyltransferase-like isoleucine patch superfamily enzyme
MKKAFRIFCSLGIIRGLTKAFLLISGVLGKVYSNLKYRALVKNCSDSICHWTTEIKYGHNLFVGANTRIGPQCTIGAKGKITIGQDVVISKGVVIESAGLDLNAGPPYNTHLAKEIEIGDGVWIGTHCLILGGVKIGKNSIIGAGTIVTKDVPDNSIVVGSPNRILK